MNPNMRLQQARQAYLRGSFPEARRLLGQLQEMLGDQLEVLHLLGLTESKEGNLAAAHEAFARSARLPDPTVEVFRDWSEILSAFGQYAAAEQVLRLGLTHHSTSRELLLVYAELKRRSDERDDAARILDHLLAGRAGDAEAMHKRALVELERGRDSRLLYSKALAAAPDDKAVLLGMAAALHAAGDTGKAIGVLAAAVDHGEPWLEGLHALARMRWERGEGTAYTKDYRRLLKRHPSHLGLWMGYLGVLASGLHYQAVLRELPLARDRLGDHSLLMMIEAQALTETGQQEASERIFKRLEPIGDSSFVPVRLRALLRSGRPDEAALLGERFTGTPGANMIWPLLGLAWRALGDPRWSWLEDYDSMVAATDLPITAAELEELAEFLRRLHAGQAHPYDQSARGGTQTSGNLLARTEPQVTRLRAALREAVDSFIKGLPPPDPRHPFLGRPRGAFRFTGSWSIRLLQQGQHVSHVHPAGWISSAFYVSVPDLDRDPLPGAGRLLLGQAPPELGLRLEPVRVIDPEPGRLALFPSTMWHRTRAFSAGERLTVAFDVVPLPG